MMKNVGIPRREKWIALLVCPFLVSLQTKILAWTW